MKKPIAFVVLFLLFKFIAVAQKPLNFYHFKGFHVGITSQVEFIEKPEFIYFMDEDLVPQGRWTCGWETGIEFSYHFAKYFGVSAGINYGTALSYKCAIYMCIIPGFNDKWENAHFSDLSSIQDHEIMFPVKFEFHYPLHKNLFFTAEVGAKIKGFFHWLNYAKEGNNGKFRYSSGVVVLVPNADNDPNKPMDQIDYFDYWGTRDVSKISCNLSLGIGLYYKFPHGDLLRFTAGINKSFNNILEGEYRYLYFPVRSYGKFFVKNDFIYTQLSYIHTLNWQKAKKYVKKQEYSFSSKKERRGKILEVLKDW